MKFRLRREQRRYFFVQKRLQSKYILVAVVCSLLAALLTGGMYALYWSIANKVIIGESPDMWATYRDANVVAGCILALWLVLVTIASLITSNKIFGPLGRIQSYIKRVGEGNFEEKIILRKGDDLMPLAEALNEMVENLKKTQQRR
ncbi:HAMP domain-containing protein [bacterium]|nr:HAMP domain-containing protein [bacterium]MBU4561147.1 HAMP domain-containing protein [bacterium]MCG2676321.1 HAMP domain-containing protein [bacterium]MCG2678194.1 HAMP domain-containing protein [bacterium]